MGYPAEELSLLPGGGPGGSHLATVWGHPLPGRGSQRAGAGQGHRGICCQQGEGSGGQALTLIFYLGLSALFSH